MISATKTDEISNDVNNDTMANPGDTLKYRVIIQNSGDTSGTNVQFTDTLDANTTLFGSVTVTPIAANDNYSISGNTTLGGMFIDASNGLLANDVDPNGGGAGGTCTGNICSVTPQTGMATAQGGTVDISPDGSFTYFPEPGNSTTDTFTYTITDAEGKTDTGTASIMFPEVIWYVKNDAPTNGNGTSDSPFNNLADAASASGPDHMIFVLSGTGVTGPTSGITLDNNESLVGQGVDLVVTFNGTPETLFAAGTPPVIGTPVTLAQNNTIKGLNIGDSSNPVVGTGIFGNGYGTLTVSDASVTTSGPTLATGGPALNLATGTLNASFASLSSTNSSGRGVSITGSAGTLSVTGATAISAPFTAGLFLGTNTAGTFNFLGGLNITNSGNTGFSASSGGTVNVTGSTNTIATTVGTALNLTNTTIGASGITFRSISANGANNGIVLNNTGTSGGLTVTGFGTPGTGGTIESTLFDGVSLTTTEKVSLSFMNITSNLDNGIGGSGVNGFVLNGCSITSNGDSAATDDSGIDLVNLTGTASAGLRPTSITNTTISNNFEFELQITNSTATALTDLQMSGNTISSNTAAAGHGNLFNFLGAGGGSANMTLNLTSGTFTGNAPFTATGVQCDHSGTGGTITCNVSDATFTNNNVGPQASVAGGAQVVFDFNGNTVTGNRSHGINVFADANAPFTKTITGRIRNNTVGTLGTAGSGSSVGFPIRVQNEGRIPVTLAITGNTVQESTSFTGINVNQGITTVAGSAATNVTITGNTVREIDSGRAIAVQQNDHLPAGGNAGTVCADISGNAFSNVAGQAEDGTQIRVRHSVNSATAVFNVRQAAPTGAINVNELDDANGFNNPALVSIGGFPTFSQGACTQPP